MNYLSDQALIALYVTTKSDHYFAQLYRRHRQRVYHRCSLFCEDPAEADDFTQEIFIRLLDILEGFKGNSAFTSWLQTVTTNYCMDQVRKRQKRQMIHRQYTEENHSTESNQAEAEELCLQLMEQVIQQLPTKKRDLLLTKYKERLPLETIAQQQKLTLSAVKMRIKRAREQARSLYVDLHANPE